MLPCRHIIAPGVSLRWKLIKKEFFVWKGQKARKGLFLESIKKIVLAVFVNFIMRKKNLWIYSAYKYFKEWHWWKFWKKNNFHHNLYTSNFMLAVLLTFTRLPFRLSWTLPIKFYIKPPQKNSPSISIAIIFYIPRSLELGTLKQQVIFRFTQHNFLSWNFILWNTFLDKKIKLLLLRIDWWKYFFIIRKNSRKLLIDA